METISESKVELTDSKPKIVPKPSPEPYAFPLFLLTFEWLTPLMWTGFRKSLEVEDLYDLEKANRSHLIAKDFQKSWEKSKSSRFALFFALCRSFGLRFLFAGVIKIMMDASNLAQPIFLRQILVFLSDPRQNVEYGYYWLLGLFGLNVIQVILNNQYFHVVMTLGFRMRSALTSIIYQKSLRLSNAARQRMTTGEITNLMSIDVSKVSGTIPYFHMIWSGVFQITVCLVFLFLLIGWVTIAGVVVMVLLMPFQTIASRVMQTIRKKILKFTDERVKAVNEILQGMKIIKFFTWEKSFLKKIADLRAQEMKFYAIMAIVAGVMTTVMTSSPIFVSVATFLLYSGLGNKLIPAVIFPALAYFNLLRFPMSFFPMIMSMAVEAKVSIERMQKYLQDSELEPRVLASDVDTPIKIVDSDFEWAQKPVEKKAEKKDTKGDEKKSLLSNDHNSIEKEKTVGKLTNINFEIKRGELTMIVGTVGSGKSSLVQGILGEMVQTKGSVTISGSIAYCPQQAWIQNATLRDNITFGKKLDQDKFDHIVHVCDLTQDLTILQAGEMTEIGEKGINLSGGQRQRVSIARATYQDTDIYIFDDPLSAVDVHVGKHIFNNCIMGELKNKTRILVTHQLQYLSHADNIIVMDKGMIIDQGNLAHHQKANGILQKMLKRYTTEESVEQVVITAKAKPEATTEKRVAKKQMQEEERTRGGISFHVIWSYIKAMGHLPVLSVVFALFLLAQTATVSADWWLSRWSSGSFPSLTPAQNLGIYAALGLSGALFLLLRNTLFLFAGLIAASRLHNKALTRVMRAPMSFFESTPLGRILSRFSKDQEVADTSIVQVLVQFLGSLFQVISTFIIISSVTYWFLLPLLPILVLYWLFQQFYRRTSRELKRLDSITRSPIFAHFGETLTGLSTIRAYCRQDYFVNENHKKIDVNQKVNYPQLVSQRWLAVRLEGIGAVLVFFSALFLIIAKGTIEPGLAGLALTYALQVTGSLSWTVRQATEVENSMNAIERIVYYTENIEQEAAAIIENNRPHNWPRDGRIDIQNLDMRYRADLPLILNKLTVSISGGEKIGVVGRTGAGKSSMMLALFRILEAAGGTISIDGVDISKIGLFDLRSNISIIPQEPIMFAGTIRSNLDPFNERTDDFLWDCLQKAHLKSAIEEFPNQLLYKVSEGGENLSVGQRQLMCLARAICKRSKILILDEATASVDLKTDALIQKTVRTQFKNCTRLTIAHRLNTIIDSDKILVMESGRVGEFDTPKNLISREDSLFTSMVNETGPATSRKLKSLALGITVEEDDTTPTSTENIETIF